MINTQTNAVLKHLRTKGTITSMEAITLYGATRLASIIMRLRKNHDITMVMQESATENQYGRKARYGLYIYKGEKVDE